MKWLETSNSYRFRRLLYGGRRVERERRVETRKREMFSQKSVRRFVGDSSAFVMIRHGRHVVSQCPKQKHFPPVSVNIF